MLNNKTLKKFLKELCGLYQKENGHSVSKLTEWCFRYTIVAEQPVLMSILTNAYEGESFGNGLEHIFAELVARKYIEEHPDGNYYITESGYNVGLEGWFSKLISYLNFNPGTNTLISLLSLLVAVIALLIAA